jgi:hypothetical protein
MLPPQLAHDELSLNQDVDRHAVTLWLTIENDAVVSARHERTLINNKNKTTYDAMRGASDGPLLQLRELLEKLSKEEDPEDLIAWAMIRYNAHLGVPRCCGAFTPSTRVVSRRGGRGWSLFRF